MLKKGKKKIDLKEENLNMRINQSMSISRLYGDPENCWRGG